MKPQPKEQMANLCSHLALMRDTAALDRPIPDGNPLTADVSGSSLFRILLCKFVSSSTGESTALKEQRVRALCLGMRRTVRCFHNVRSTRGETVRGTSRIPHEANVPGRRDMPKLRFCRLASRSRPQPWPLDRLRQMLSPLLTTKTSFFAMELNGNWHTQAPMRLKCPFAFRNA